jgi:hypothetical protein
MMSMARDERGRKQILLVNRLSRLALAALLVPALLLMSGASTALVEAASPVAQDVPDPPELGELLFQTALTGPEVFAPGSCPTGAASGENVEEGFKLSVRGKCVPEAEAANLPVPGREITVWDGEVALDFRVDAGAERAGINLYARIHEGRYMAAYLSLATGRAELFRRENGMNTVVASRNDLSDLDPSAWNRLALRLRGGQLWLMLNNTPLLYASEVLDQTGGIGIAVVREGNVGDSDEVAVVFKDLAVTGFPESPGEAPTPEETGPPSKPALNP